MQALDIALAAASADGLCAQRPKPPVCGTCNPLRDGMPPGRAAAITLHVTTSTRVLEQAAAACVLPRRPASRRAGRACVRRGRSGPPALLSPRCCRRSATCFTRCGASGSATSWRRCCWSSQGRAAQQAAPPPPRSSSCCCHLMTLGWQLRRDAGEAGPRDHHNTGGGGYLPSWLTRVSVNHQS